ncbi:hypothetical protein VTN96DRAFT_9400 [Rasamsonia emersonii]|uniref:Zinc-binding alcohol dehydrogenase domain-containing protein cipB n=1 Tax=Rasamsonia emersonii (strain ATCC 16479 / CBS 393.64 / IMI 116815) TaxID=1408163 RepID=A0A0F4YV61_RASE3|nr:Zinc-binding alcohol dehydrogenase domain-containing protein cipB [Rasamsonia emersonii CBS 393.64]KKA22000.1 Zinc-binding alcohol dehydrogenase domain-containing protein cipB [Rasamsonia emersonii CBS 393.64]
MPSNTAAWLAAEKATPLEVKSAPYTPPRENEIVIRARAVAINPVDCFIQIMGNALFSWLQYPFILGSDVAGEVAEVGSGVTRFKVGDRVVGTGIGRVTNNPAEGAFQEYVVVLEHMASPIPDRVSYESAAVLPLGVSTAACGLFQKDCLGLQLPTVPPKPTGKTLLIWGGSTSVGSNAIQLAVAAGYEVITTASPRNFDYVKKLGASQVFDYHSETIVDELVEAFKGKTCAGAFAIGQTASVSCVEVVARTEGTKFVALANPLPEGHVVPDGIGTKFFFASDIKDNEVSHAIYGDFLPKALAAGTYICAPDPEVVGKGLENIQPAFEILRNGVSAKKLVVSL